MKVKDIAAITCAPMEIIRYNEDGEPENLHSIYGPCDMEAMPDEVAELIVDSVNHGREAIIIIV